MFFRSFFDEYLAHMSYLVGCQRTGEAIIIDPARNIDQYLEVAEKEELTITAAAETHIHADYLSGAKEIAKQCDATLYLSDEGDKNWKYAFVDEVKHVLLREGEKFQIGHIDFEVIHTPGHTPESISFILTDLGGGASEPMGIFTGDFVFVGDVGRPDLLEKAAGEEGTADVGARLMFQSLKKFKELPDFLQVWPAHGAGSACGKALGAVPSSTVGYEKRNNWALQIDDEEKFVETLLAGQPEPPTYFAMMKKLNKLGPNDLRYLPIKKLKSVDELNKYGSDTYILDTRAPELFAYAHYKHAINIPFTTALPNWAGWLLDYDKDIVLVSPADDVEYIRRALASIGLDRVVATIVPTITLEDETLVENYEKIDVEQLQSYRNDSDYHIIDVRNQDEWEAGRIEPAQHIMLGTLPKRLDELPQGKTYITYCRAEGRSAIAASILQANGFNNVMIVNGGYLAWTREKSTV